MVNSNERPYAKEYYRDPSPVSPPVKEYDENEVSPEVKNYVKQLSSKMKGMDTREVLRRAVEIIDLVAGDAKDTSVATKARQDDVEKRFDDQIAGNTDIDEVIDARRPEGEEAYPTLRRRLDEEHQEVTTQLAHTNDNIDSIKLVGDKFGVKADGVSDDSDAIQFLLDNSDGVIQLPRYKNIYLEKPLIWGDSNVHEIDFGFSDILAPNGVIKINRTGRKIHQQKPTLKNGYLDSTQTMSDVKTTTAIEIGTNVEWGSSVRLDNLTIKGYQIGFYGNSLYELETMSVKFERCEIGMYLHSHESGNITDCSEVNDIYFDYNKYSIIISDCINMTFSNMTIEHSDYGVVVTGYDNEDVLFRNTYFEENIKANITTGRVNLNTLQLSQDGLGDTGLNGVKFEQTRYRPHTTHAPIFNEEFPFTSKYLEIGENFSERLLSGGELETKNIFIGFPTRVRQAGDATVYIGPKKTPFGEVDVVEIEGNNLAEGISIPIDINTENVEPNSTFLFKCIVKIETGGNTSYRHALRPQLTNAASNIYFSQEHAVNKRLRANRWEPFSRIIEMRQRNSDYDGTLLLSVLLNSNYSLNKQLIEGDLKITFLNPMIINLTDVFGKGNEPTQGMEDEVSNWFKYNGDYATD